MNSIISVERYQELLGIDNISLPQITNIQTLIKVVSDMIENILGYDLELQDRTELINKNIRINRLWVKCPPIDSITEIKINNKVIDAIDYQFTKLKIEFKDTFCDCNCGCTYTEKDTIELKYKSGYVFGDNGNVPYDLQYAVARMVQSLLMIQNDPDMIKYSSYKINDIAYSYKEAEQRTAEMILLPALRQLMV